MRPFAMLPRMRFTLATAMELVVTAAVASALFAKVHRYTPPSGLTYLRIDAPILFVLSIVLTAVALGSLKGHTPGQMMLQVVVACLGFLSLVTLAENHWQRPLLYWFQVGFGVQVTLPLLARGIVKSEMERGPRRGWWKGTFEAVFFSFLTMMLVLVGILLQWLAAMIGGAILKF